MKVRVWTVRPLIAIVALLTTLCSGSCGGGSPDGGATTPTPVPATPTVPSGSSSSGLPGIYRLTLTTSPSCAAYPNKTLSFGPVLIEVSPNSSFTGVESTFLTCDCGTWYGRLMSGTLTMGMSVLGTVSTSGVVSAPVTDRKILISGPFTTTATTSPITGTASLVILFQHGATPNVVVDEGCNVGGHTFTLTRQ